MLRIVVVALISFAVIWLAFVMYLLIAKPSGSSLRDTLRLLPDALRLISRLARDKTLPKGVRVRLWLAVGYLALPIDIVPDFLPVIGYADDVIVLIAALRSVVKRSGTQAVERHWPGTDEGLTFLLRIAHITDPPTGG